MNKDSVLKLKMISVHYAQSYKNLYNICLLDVYICQS